MYMVCSYRPTCSTLVFLGDDPVPNSNNNNSESVDEGYLPSEERDTLSPLPSSPSPTNKRYFVYCSKVCVQ